MAIRCGTLADRCLGQRRVSVGGGCARSGLNGTSVRAAPQVQDVRQAAARMSRSCPTLLAEGQARRSGERHEVTRSGPIQSALHTTPSQIHTGDATVMSQCAFPARWAGTLVLARRRGGSGRTKPPRRGRSRAAARALDRRQCSTRPGIRGDAARSSSRPRHYTR
jgi:hypothetical protein